MHSSRERSEQFLRIWSRALSPCDYSTDLIFPSGTLRAQDTLTTYEHLAAIQSRFHSRPGCFSAAVICFIGETQGYNLPAIWKLLHSRTRKGSQAGSPQDSAGSYQVMKQTTPL